MTSFSLLIYAVLVFTHWTMAQERLDDTNFGQPLILPVKMPPCPECELSSSSPDGQKYRAKKLQERADEMRELWAVVDCARASVQNSELGLLFTQAVKSIACPKDMEASRTAQRWKVWWDKQKSGIPFDTRRASDLFYDYVSRRLYSEIEATPETLAIEKELVGLLQPT